MDFQTEGWGGKRNFESVARQGVSYRVGRWNSVDIVSFKKESYTYPRIASQIQAHAIGVHIHIIPQSVTPTQESRSLSLFLATGVFPFLYNPRRELNDVDVPLPGRARNLAATDQGAKVGSLDTNL